MILLPNKASSEKSVKPAVLLLVLVGFCLSSCKAAAVGQRSEFVLGTVCTVNAFGDGTNALYDELFARLHKIDSDFSVNRDDSEVSQINKAAGDHAVSVRGDVFYVIQTALHYAELTAGAFDPTVGPIVKLWGINTDHARVPSQKEIDKALPFVNWRDVVVTPVSFRTEDTSRAVAASRIADISSTTDGAGTVFLKRAGMSIDLGGIAKGFAADELVRILDAHKVKRAVIDLGGNIYVHGKKSDGSLWKVGVKNPDNPEEEIPALALTLSDSTVVTSGVYERFFMQNGKRYHHIINPKTGYPAETGLLSSTIICHSSITADALSTSVFVLGEDKGFGLLKNMNDVSAVFITEEHRVYASKILENDLSVIGSEYSSVSYR
jgi:FAD:protein FMN transferase